MVESIVVKIMKNKISLILRTFILPHKRGIMIGILLSVIINLIEFSFFGGSVYGFLVLSGLYQILYLVN